MVVLVESMNGSASANVATAGFIIPGAVRRQHRVKVVEVTLPPRPMVFAAGNQVTSGAELFGVPDCASFAELAVALSALRHADTSRVIECYSTNEEEFEVCTFSSPVTLDATLAAQLNVGEQLLANTCYGASVHRADVDACHATRIVMDGTTVRGMFSANAPTNVVAQYGTTLGQTSVFSVEPTDAFSVAAEIVMKDGTVVSYPVADNERFSFAVEIV